VQLPKFSHEEKAAFNRPSKTTLGDFMIRATKRFLMLIILVLPAYEASAENSVYLDCSEVMSKKNAWVDRKYWDYIRVFPDVGIETLSYDWTWNDYKSRVEIGRYCGGAIGVIYCLDRATLQASISFGVDPEYARQEKRQCVIVPAEAFEAERDKVLKQLQAAEEAQRKKNVL
jgi:hypothetical protein